MNNVKTVRYQFYKSTQNYHVYWELDEDGKLVAAGQPKERYAMNCRPDQYLPHALFNKGVVAVIHIAIEGK